MTYNPPSYRIIVHGDLEANTLESLVIQPDEFGHLRPETRTPRVGCA
jgi:hypothetical protein